VDWFLISNQQSAIKECGLTSKLKEWGAFALLGLIWGSSFLWIKIGLREIGPVTLVAFRLLFGLIGLLVVMGLQRQPFPRERRVILAYLGLSIFQTAMPFVLISWGETRIDSGLAAILNGTMPLFTIVIAHFWLQDDKLTWPRLVGLMVGFGGVVVLVSRDLKPGGGFWGQLAVLVAAISYAAATTLSRKYLRGQPPVVQSTMFLAFATPLVWLLVPLGESPVRFPSHAITWLGLLWLGLLGSCLAYILFFYLLNSWGPTRASLVTYVFPVIGLILGIVFLREQPDWRLFVGALLVVGGIVIVNFKVKNL